MKENIPGCEDPLTRRHHRGGFDVHTPHFIHARGHLQSAQTYRVLSCAATCIMALAIVAMTACRAAAPNPEVSPETAQAGPVDEAPKSQRTEDVLFDAIVEESGARGYGLATVSPRFLVVVTDYEQVSARLRKRRIMKIIVLPRGGALNVTVSYERDAGVEGAPDWTVLEDANTRTRASKEEVELARAIEERLHVMKRQRARGR